MLDNHLETAGAGAVIRSFGAWAARECKGWRQHLRHVLTSIADLMLEEDENRLNQLDKTGSRFGFAPHNRRITKAVCTNLLMVWTRP